MAFNNTSRSKASYCLRLMLSSINSVSKRDQVEVYFHELKSKRPLFLMSDYWFQSILRVSMFQGLLLVIVIIIDGSEKRNSDDLAFKLHSSRLMNGFKLG